MIGKIFDIFTVGSIFLLGISALHFKRSSVLHSDGYLLYGIGSVLISLSLLLFKFGISFYAFFIVIAFIVVQIGNVVLMTKEKHIRESYRRLPFRKRLLVGFFPQWAVQEKMKVEEESSTQLKKAHNKQTMLTGLFMVSAGVAVYFWRKEYIYPAFLIGTGILFIIAGKIYSSREQRKPN